MDFITIFAGIIIITFGVYTFYARIQTPDKFAKLQAMREKFGHGAGTAVHTIAYSVMPLVFGGIIVNAGLNGISLMQFIAA